MNIQRIIQRLKTDRLFAFRIIMFFLFLDTVAVLSLARIQPLQFVNIVKFLSIPKPDDRRILTLYYPRSLHSGLGKLSIDRMVVGSKERVLLYNAKEKDSLRQNAKRILIHLAADPVNAEGKKAYTYYDIPKTIWVNQKAIYVAMDDSFKNIPGEEKEILTQCISKSLGENLDVETVELVLP